MLRVKGHGTAFKFNKEAPKKKKKCEQLEGRDFISFFL